MAPTPFRTPQPVPVNLKKTLMRGVPDNASIPNKLHSEPGGSAITRVYTDMVADLFHYGHVNFLRQAKAQGDYLLVGIHGDEDVMTYKHRPILSMEERVASVEGCRYVDEVVGDAPLSIDRAWIERHRIDLVVHGDDFSPEMEERFYKTPIEMGIYRSVDYTPGISSSEIIKRIRAIDVD